MASWPSVSARVVRVRLLRWSLTAGSALGTWCVVYAASERHLDDALLTLGATLGQALHVERHAPVVDWAALDREVAQSEPSTEGGTPVAEARSGLEARAANKAKGRKSQASPSVKTIVVTAEQVLRLSKVARVPASRFVEQQGARPAGLQVAGVSGLGIGVRDGDVLTNVAGTQVQSSAGVISLVLRLRAQHAAAVSGEAWRGQERYRIVFQMPYVTPSSASSGSGASSVASNSVPNAAESSAVARN